MDNGSISKVVWEGEVPKDLCGNRGCFAYIDGQCDCLADTDFGGSACPFFKDRKQYERELKDAGNGGRSAAENATQYDDDDFLAQNADAVAEIAGMEAEADRIEREGISEEGGGSDDDGWDDIEDGQAGTAGE